MTSQTPQWNTYTPNAQRPPQAGRVTDRRGRPVAQSADDQGFAMAAHLAAPVAAVLSVGWLNFVGPLVVWLLVRDRSAFSRTAAAGAFNFAVSMSVLGVLGWMMIFSVILLPLGLVLVGASSFLVILLGIVGALRTSRGSSFTYPFQLRILN